MRFTLEVWLQIEMAWRRAMLLEYMDGKDAFV